MRPAPPMRYFGCGSDFVTPGAVRASEGCLL